MSRRDDVDRSPISCDGRRVVSRDGHRFRVACDRCGTVRWTVKVGWAMSLAGRCGRVHR